MDDFTKECLGTSKIDGKELSEKDLRSLFCKQCKNYKCGHARWKRPSWEERMENQEERLLNNPNFGDPNSSKWDFLREIDFPDLVKKALLLEAADRKGDWSLPSVFEAFDPSIDEKKLEPEPEPEPESKAIPPPEITEIKIKSNSKDTVYTVTLEDGKAVSCTCSAGVRRRKCSHLQEAEKSYVMEGFKKEKEEEKKEKEEEKKEKDKDEDKVEFPVIQLSQEEKRELGGIHLIKNSSCDPHGIMISGEGKAVPNTPPKKKEDPWERKEKEKVVKPGTVIKL